MRYVNVNRCQNSPTRGQWTILNNECSRAARPGREAPLTDHEPELFWDSTYAIVVSLLEHHPHREPINVGLEELASLVESLPGFQDDPALVTEQLLLDILTVWYEEATTL